MRTPLIDTEPTGERPVQSAVDGLWHAEKLSCIERENLCP